jgi:hypothetical protein
MLFLLNDYLLFWVSVFGLHFGQAAASPAVSQITCTHEARPLLLTQLAYFQKMFQSCAEGRRQREQSSRAAGRSQCTSVSLVQTCTARAQPFQRSAMPEVSEDPQTGCLPSSWNPLQAFPWDLQMRSHARPLPSTCPQRRMICSRRTQACRSSPCRRPLPAATLWDQRGACGNAVASDSRPASPPHQPLLGKGS